MDVAENKLRAEKMDLADGIAFMRQGVTITADTGIVTRLKVAW